MRRITVTASTLGQANPAHVGEGNYYRRFGDPDWTPNDPRFRETAKQGPPAGSPKSTAARAARMAAFAAAREDGKSVAEAGRIAGVTPPTAKTYERERKTPDGGAAS